MTRGRHRLPVTLTLLFVFVAAGCDTAPRPATPAGGYGARGGASAVETGSGLPVPGTLPDVWREIMARRSELNAAGAPAADIARCAIRIRELAAALPRLSGQYVPTREGPLDEDVSRIRGITRRLATDHGAGGADTTRETAPEAADSVADAIGELNRVLDHIASLYPPGVLPAP